MSLEPVEVPGAGYFQFGSCVPTPGLPAYSLSVCLESCSLVDGLGHGSVYLVYQLLNTDITSDTFSPGHAFEAERATARVHSTPETLLAYLSRACLSVSLCSPSLPQVLASSHSLVLGTTLGASPAWDTGAALTARSSLPLLSAQGEGEEVGKVSLYLCLQALPHSDPALSTGRLSLSVSRASSVSVQEQQSTEPPVQAPPSVLQATDLTDYHSPPKAPKMLTSPSGPQVIRQWKFSIELLGLSWSPPTSLSSLVLVYKYLALHPRCVTTQPPFPCPTGCMSPVPRGYCLFSFSASRDKLEATFTSHSLRVGAYEAGRKVATATLNMADIFKQDSIRGVRSWRGNSELLSDQGTRLGNLEIELELVDCLEQGLQQNKTVKEDISRDVHNQSDPMETSVEKAKLLTDAAQELQAWKNEQKKLFNQNLLKLESQHLDMLGREWKDREVDREKLHAEKLQSIKELEIELRKELKEMDVQRKALESSKNEIEKEKNNLKILEDQLKGEKGNVIDKVKLKLKESEALVASKCMEISALEKQVISLKDDLRKSEETKKTKKDKNEREFNELLQLRAEKATWEAGRENCEKERKFYEENCKTLQKEVDTLRMNQERSYNQQIVKLEEKVRELSDQLKLQNHPSISSSARFVPEIEVLELQDKTESVSHRMVHKETETSSSLQQSPREKERKLKLRNLRDQRAMLLRTGVYAEDDPLVIHFDQQIKLFE